LAGQSWFVKKHFAFFQFPRRAETPLSRRQVHFKAVLSEIFLPIFTSCGHPTKPMYDGMAADFVADIPGHPRPSQSAHSGKS
jgi:hypothetical protein